MAAFTVIDHQELGASTWAPSGTGTAASWSKTSIPSSYDHLLIVASIRSSKSADYDKVDLQMGNGSLDTGTNYSQTVLHTNSATPTSARLTGQDSIDYIYVSADSATANTFGTVKIWIPHYTSSNYKQAICTSTAENASAVDGEWFLRVAAGLWQSTSAVDAVGIKETGDDLMQYSTVTLYGITGA